jgi:hypothetical protein
MVGSQQVEHIVACLACDSRKNNACVIDVSQNPGDLLAAGIANQIGTAFGSATRGPDLHLLDLGWGGAS